MDEVVWSPFSCLENTEKQDIVLVKLNTPFGDGKKTFNTLWRKACFKSVVDGAVNELYQCPDLARDEFIPDLISGDFDSARPEVLDHYRHKGVEVVPTPDQNETDFTKTLCIVCERITKLTQSVSCICVHVSFDGRFDHIMANINTIVKAREMTKLPVYLVSGESIAFIIPQGRSCVSVSEDRLGNYCGLIPICGPCHSVTTTGLKYNMDKHGMSFGGLVSTSNNVVNGVVTIDTDNDILFTISM